MKSMRQFVLATVVLATLVGSSLALTFKCHSDDCQIGFWNGAQITWTDVPEGTIVDTAQGAILTGGWGVIE